MNLILVCLFPTDIERDFDTKHSTALAIDASQASVGLMIFSVTDFEHSIRPKIKNEFRTVIYIPGIIVHHPSSCSCM
jgi:hypothetical protein